MQKNLVYVTGLTPTVREDELLKTLRKPEFFGQYGNIQKISISNRKGTDGHNQSLGIYVTFEKKEDAARCIQAVNGSQNGDRILRAQLGTTKYCSAWLRHEQCNNRQCMFLHELGDEEDSYSRQDLSSLNSLNSLGNQQRPAVNAGTSRSASRQQVHAQVQQQGLQSQQQAAQPQQQAAQPMTRSLSKEGSENDDGSALPSSANWARNPQARSRQGSHATSGAAPSPAISNALPNTTEVGPETINQPSQEATAESSAEHGAVIATSSETEPVTTELDPLQAFLKKIMDSLGKSGELPTPLGDHTDVGAHPPLFDPRGGEKRRALREEEDARLADEQDANSDAAEPTEIETGRSGSLALGGEPEDRGHGRDAPGFDMRRGSQPPIQRGSNEGIFGPAFGTGFGQPAGAVGSIGARTLTPQQHGLMRPQGSFVDSLPPGLTSQSNLFQGQGQGHIRQGSRYSFANDNRDTAATSVKLAANPRVMAQQSAMMPSSFHSPAGATPYYGSSMPGPPPGIKSTATPPNLFGQHGFGGFGNAPKDSNELHSILNRGRGAGNQALDAGKREFMFSSFPNQFPPSTSSTPAPVSSFMGPLYGAQPGAFQDFGSKQKKKGRKHRHANTSSFGGSGLVDLADPSILQARIQHQQQSNAGVGQALFGAQSQGGYNPGMVYGNQYGGRW